MEKKLRRGDRVITLYGKVETVRKVEELAIYTYEDTAGWYHPTKLWRTK